MEEMSATTNETAVTQAETEPTTAQSGGMNGEDLFSRYESGASIEELNGLLAQESARPEQQNETDPEENAAEEAEEAPTEAEPQTPQQTERTFTQAEVNRIIGQRIREPQDKYSALLDDLAVVLNVDRSQVAETARRQRLEAQAREKGIEDVELYAQKEQLEQQSRAMQEQQYYRQLANDMDTQRRNAGISDEQYRMMMDNPQFIVTAKNLYDNPNTRETALKTAYQAVYFDELLKARVAAEKEKLVDNIKAGRQRVTEGAMQKSANASAKIDVSKLTDAQLEEYIDRARRGETITF